MVITCGLRGLALFDLQVTGPKGDLHSGLHGGVLRNPIQALAEMFATLHTPDGRVNVPGFYDDVLDVHPWEREELKKLGADEKAYKEFLGIDTFYTTPGFTPFEALRFQPTLEFNGIGGGYQGRGEQDGDPEQGLREDQLPARAEPDAGQDQATRHGGDSGADADGREDRIRRSAQRRSLCRGAAGPIEHAEGSVAGAGARVPATDTAVTRSLGTPAALFARRRQRADHRRHQARDWDSIRSCSVCFCRRTICTRRTKALIST